MVTSRRQNRQHTQNRNKAKQSKAKQSKANHTIPNQTTPNQKQPKKPKQAGKREDNAILGTDIASKGQAVLKYPTFNFTTENEQKNRKAENHKKQKLVNINTLKLKEIKERLKSILNTDFVLGEKVTVSNFSESTKEE